MVRYMENALKTETSDLNGPNFHRDIFPYSEIPKIQFNFKNIPMDIPDEIWITDTTFRDGQQSMAPFSVEQIVKIFDYLHNLDNNSGIIRQTEFFVYSEKDREAIYKCLSKGYKYPEVTTWIRANKEDFKLVKEAGVKETGILMSCSDYHIFKKLKVNRKKAMDMYLSFVKEALSYGIRPRCHLEDITRADYFGFVVPFVEEIMKLSEEAGIPAKIRLCDTLGLGVPYSGALLPRSVQAIIYGLRHYLKVPPQDIEWHGHNDFYNVVSNSTTAWLYGTSSVNTTLFGIGERTGNCPLEAMIIEYGQIKGNICKMNLHIIAEIAEYFEKELNYSIPPRTPFVGSEFNVTRAGIHADGILKDEEIYNIFDTKKILNRDVVVAINQYSGLAGIAAWINKHFKLKENNAVDKKNKGVKKIKEMIDDEYKSGRTTIMSNEELERMVSEVMPEIFSRKEG